MSFMDLKNICQHIYFAVVSAIGECKSPIAYINVRLGKRFPYSDDELNEAFKKAKWDTVISSADLNIYRDDTIDCLLQIEEISDFYDEDGKCDIFRVPDEDAVLN